MNMIDEEIANSFLFLDAAIKNLLYDLKCISNSPIKIKSHYISYIEEKLSKSRFKMNKIKKEMHDRNIQVIHIDNDHMFSVYQYILGNYEKEISYHKSIIKKNVEKIIHNL